AGSYTIAKLRTLQKTTGSGQATINGTPYFSLGDILPVGFTPDLQFDSHVSTIMSVYKDFKEKLRVLYPSSYFGSYNQTLTMYGTGFANSGNVLHFGNNDKIENLSSPDHVRLSFTIPLGIRAGKHNIWVSNSTGQSNQEQFFIVTPINAEAPRIDAVTPKEGPNGTRVEITGSGFLPVNEIRTSYGTYTVESADRRNISFTVDFHIFDKLQKLRDRGNEKVTATKIPVTLQVMNENGLSDSILFYITLR
ncbi:MAG TPA: IPT/TIG domain-containing protein, partial [Candidatus Paceibacterota bacterium]